MIETIISKFSALQIWLTHRRLPISFPNTFLWLLPNIEKKGISLDDDIVRCKNSIVFKYLAKSCGFFLLGAPKYLPAAKFFYSLFPQRFSLPLVIRGRSRAAATSKIERFVISIVIIVNGWKLLTIISKRSILDAAAALDPPLLILDILLRNNSYLLGVRFLINNRVTTCPSWKLGKKVKVLFPNRTWTQKNKTFG